jgi:hypothetical protein
VKKSLLACIILVLSVAKSWAQSPFDGTWKFKQNSEKLDPKPDVRVLKNGRYQCSTCVPKIDITADGKDHPIKGSPYFDTMSVKVVDPNTVEVQEMKDGKPVYGERDSVDGNQLTIAWNFKPPEKDQPLKGTYVETRVGEAPSEARAISGSWKAEKIAEVSDNLGVVTFKSTGDGITAQGSDGSSYTAKFDGKDYPYHGDPGVTSVTLRKTSENSFEEIDKRNGKAVVIDHISVSSDVQTLTIQQEDKLAGRTTTYSFTKQ